MICFGYGVEVGVLTNNGMGSVVKDSGRFVNWKRFWPNYEKSGREWKERKNNNI